MPFPTRIALFAAAIALSAPALQAADEHRQLDAHEHGRGTLSIAIENNRVAMELEVPGMDIAGFEHEAKTGADKKTLDEAKAKLGDPLALFKLPAAAGCKTTEVKVELETGEDHDEHGSAKDHDHDEKKDAANKPDHDEGKHEDEEAGHTGFHVTYALACEKPDALTAIEFAYFKVFAGAEKLWVNVVSAKSQGAFEVTREKPSLDLSGTM